MLQNWPYRI